mgnify:CR=1 FL=1
MRRSGPFISENCAAISPSLLDAELFGHTRGAFTGANRDKEGKFMAAGQGTLLLDEIDVLSIDQQAKLLRVLEDGLILRSQATLFKSHAADWSDGAKQILRELEQRLGD